MPMYKARAILDDEWEADSLEDARRDWEDTIKEIAKDNLLSFEIVDVEVVEA